MKIRGLGKSKKMNFFIKRYFLQSFFQGKKFLNENKDEKTEISTLKNVARAGSFPQFI